MTLPHPGPARPAGLSRRTLLRGTGVLGLGLAAAACGGPGATSDPATTDPTANPSLQPAEEAAGAALAAVGYEGDITLGPTFTGFELLARDGERLTFALFDTGRELVTDTAVQVWLVRTDTHEVAAGPFEPDWFTNGRSYQGVEDGLYHAIVDLDGLATGLHHLVVVTDDGARGGAAPVNVIAVDASSFLVPGDDFPPVATPTVEDPQDLAELCTREPDCGMHEVSLDTALAAGTPVVLSIATPKFCSSAICGPVVDFVEEVRLASDRTDIAWIHQEVFTDAGNTLVELAKVIQLPSEPWLFLIDGSGKVTDRISGAVTPGMLAPAVTTL